MPTLSAGIKLGTAILKNGPHGRRALVAELPSGSGRVVDLNRVEMARLAKLGEGDPDGLANVLVPPSLRKLLESGERGIRRAAQALLYAAKWDLRSGLPDLLAPWPGSYEPLPCLPRPLAIRNSSGHFLDRLNVHGPRATLPAVAEPTIAVIGSAGAGHAGFCIAANSPVGPILGAWLCIGELEQGEFSVEIGKRKIKASTETWAGLVPPRLKPSEVLLLPPPLLRLPSNAPLAGKVVIRAPFDSLEVNFEPEPVHPTLQ